MPDSYAEFVLWGSLVAFLTSWTITKLASRAKINYEAKSEFGNAVNDLFAVFVSGNAVDWFEAEKFWKDFYTWCAKLGLPGHITFRFPPKLVRNALLYTASHESDTVIELKPDTLKIISAWAKLDQRARNIRSIHSAVLGIVLGFLFGLILRYLSGDRL